MEHTLAYTFITCCICFLVLPVVGHSWSKHRYPLYRPSYLECLFCGIVIIGAISVVLLFFYALLWSITTLGA
jgi:hypothetical protein